MLTPSADVDRVLRPARGAKPACRAVRPLLDIETEPTTVGLVANTFVDASRFLDFVETALRELVPSLTVLRFIKPSTSAASSDLRRTIFANCTAVISAYGH